MASITYNAITGDCVHIFSTTSGGTVFSSDYGSTAAFDYFDDSAVVDDAIYFSSIGYYYDSKISDLVLNVGTALAADSITIVWEYYHYGLEDWVAIPNLTDNTNGFQTTGVNTVEFPVPPYMYYTYVNSVRWCWIRARITAVTNITEGGANQTTAPYAGDGYVRTSGYTSGSPLSCEALYNWIVANTVIPAVRRGNYYEFPCGISNSDDSYWTTSDEIILLSNGASFLQPRLGNSFTSGIEKGNYGGTGGSMILICNRTGSSTVNMAGSKFYGSYIKDFPYWDEANSYAPTGAPSKRLSLQSVTGKASYFADAGYLNATGPLNRCVLTGSMVSSGSFFDSTNLADMISVGDSTGCFRFYNVSQTYRDIVMTGYESGYLVQFASYPTTKYQIAWINPTPRLPEADASSPPYFSTEMSAAAVAKFFEKWTLNIKVTDEQGNPIEGANVKITDENGYNKTFEYATLLAENVDDTETSILVVDGTQFTAGQYINFQNEIVLIDSISTNTLTVTREQQGTYAADSVLINNKIYKIVDSTQTDANGDIEEQLLQARMFYYDAGSSNYGHVEQETTENYTIEISKSGYKSYKSVVTVNQKMDLTIRLAKVKDLNFSNSVKIITQ